MKIDEIELKICTGELTAAQVFTQMRQHVASKSKWTDTKDKEPTNEKSMYWVLFKDCGVKIYKFINYKQTGGMYNYWRDSQGNDELTNNTKYIEITKPEPPQQ